MTKIEVHLYTQSQPSGVPRVQRGLPEEGRWIGASSSRA